MARKKAKRVGNTPAARVSAKVSKILRTEKGKSRSQAVAIAHSMEERGEL